MLMNHVSLVIYKGWSLDQINWLLNVYDLWLWLRIRLLWWTPFSAWVRLESRVFWHGSSWIEHKRNL